MARCYSWSRAEESEAIFRGLHAGPSLAEALKLAWAEGPRFVVATDLEELAVQATRQGHAQCAVHLLSSAATLRRPPAELIRKCGEHEQREQPAQEQST